jgi:hypothetical protein
VKIKTWQYVGLEGLVVAAVVYLIMRFFVSHAQDNDTRSVIGAVVTFFVTFIVLQFGETRKA